ncbi:UDP-galactopyranose mutase [Sphingomonas sp.]|uniref:UDP-galactopyranose mutase n=1 Tax=Sphingomonas sp. TaxID=28214 RepID=UPI002D801177|nr:UDP-galactopyranose mutase [Sphingomonas sp.]HEU0045691.1 UDP-galactopyranose mutase [Sphingomonas sp.]
MKPTPQTLVRSATLLCFSHLRWDFVTQRPQHLMRRFARGRRVFFWEEPIGSDHALPYLEHHHFPDDGVIALRPRLPTAWSLEEKEAGLKRLLDQFVATSVPEAPVAWFYTPMMWGWARHLNTAAVVYDCMDELSAFAHADPLLVQRESALLASADVVFTGGRSLYEAKRRRHDNVHAFPSSIEAEHFAHARCATEEPADQRDLPRPRLGYYGVIDERLDLGLIDAVAAARPDWQIVMIGPVVKIDAGQLPRRANIHWLGGRGYDELPQYLGGWDVALMPFAMNEATRYISPTKTPEYLAGGKPVVSTPIADVVADYGRLDAVKIAATPDQFVAACDAALALPRQGAWLKAADTVLAQTSWDKTQAAMDALIGAALARRKSAAAPAIRAGNATPDYDVLVVGAGFAGSVLAERLATQSGQRVLLIDRRDHVAGNAYDEQDAAGILIHRYGPHIFHTNSQDVWDYLSKFTKWRPYEHRVLAQVRDKLLPVPINRTTLNKLYDLDLQDDAQAAAYLASRAEPVAEIKTSEDVVVAAVGRELYETFFRGYTRKQWGMDPSELDRTVTARVPTRTNTDDRYFTDKFQAMPLDGYTRMFENMLDHPLIDIELGVDFRDVASRVTVGHTIFTGPVDEYFDHRFGPLPYRCLTFRHETHDREQFQPVAVVNYPLEDTPYTRITEYKHLTGQRHKQTSVSYEFSSATGDPYYPIPNAAAAALYKKYEALADAEPKVSFVGRLATYKYYNMDQVVGQALATYRRLAGRLPTRQDARVTSSDAS